jgi:cystathionine gamma-synthase
LLLESSTLLDAMTVLKPEAELGHCIPPESNYAITTYVPGWDTAVAFREGDPAVLAKIVHIYPRFGPFRTVGEVSQLQTHSP